MSNRRFCYSKARFDLKRYVSCRRSTIKGEAGKQLEAKVAALSAGRAECREFTSLVDHMLSQKYRSIPMYCRQFSTFTRRKSVESCYWVLSQGVYVDA
jgi:hypothetical protein